MRVLLLTCCEVAVIDQRTNNVSLINLLQDINSPTFPAISPRLSMAAIIDRQQDEPGTVEATIRVALADQKIFEAPYRIDFQGRLRVRAVADFQSGIVVPAPGLLRWILVHGETGLGSWSVQVNQVGAPKPDLFAGPQGKPLTPAT